MDLGPITFRVILDVNGHSVVVGSFEANSEDEVRPALAQFLRDVADEVENGDGSL